MLTNIDIDEELIAKAMQLSGARTKRDAVDRALREMVARTQRARLRDVFGIATDDTYWPDYDPKAAPGEPPGMHRVEQPRATYRTAPPVPVHKPPSRKK